MKLWSMVSICLLTFSCGKKETVFAQCGNPDLGQFICDTDNISITYTKDNIVKNGWMNSSGSAITGPFLNLEPGEGSFLSKELFFTSNIQNSTGYILKDTNDPCNQLLVNTNLFDLEITGDLNGQSVVLFQTSAHVDMAFKNVSRTFPPVASCAYTGNLIGLGRYTDPSTGKRFFTLNIPNINPDMNSFQVKILNNRIDSPLLETSLEIKGNR